MLDALATALMLTEDERAHLHTVARHAASAGSTPVRPSPAVRPGLRQLLDTVRPTPAHVLSPTSDILAANPEGLHLLTGIDAWPEPRRNLIRYVFTHPRAQDLFGSWRLMAQDCVAHLRTVEAADPDSPALAALVAELAPVSVEFADLWRTYDVRVKRGARRKFQHPAVGRVELESDILTSADGQRFVVFQARPGSADHDALTLLAMTATGRPAPR